MRTRPRRSMATRAILVLAVALSLLPFVAALLPSVTSAAQFARDGLAWPSPVTIENFVAVLREPSILLGPALTTAVAGLVVCATQMTSAVCAAYAFSRLRFPGREALFILVIALWAVPPIVLIVPLYLGFARVGLSGTFAALILPSALISPYAIFLLRQSFASLPGELFEAAAIDGASNARIVTSILIPASWPALATVAVVIMTTTWNSYLWPRLIAGVQLPQVQVAISSLRTQYDDRWTLVMAASVLATLPTIALVIALRRGFVHTLEPSEAGDPK